MRKDYPNDLLVIRQRNLANKLLLLISKALTTLNLFYIMLSFTYNLNYVILYV
ncbi:protein of unknown function [Streptococcus thermophilus]|nr:protein of unknown function [Streptococcus thermophilus]CAD0123197.1 protein of unknown function [Streptococcus thermophilus]CAD0132964.1 protein of unknown function [Streptococcus thermophilus]